MFRIGVLTNPWHLVGVVVMVQMAFTYAPFMNHVPHTAPISAGAWLRIAAVAFAAWSIIGFEKWVRRPVGDL